MVPVKGAPSIKSIKLTPSHMNCYPSQIKLDDQVHVSGEQAYQHTKALRCGERGKANEILQLKIFNNERESKQARSQGGGGAGGSNDPPSLDHSL